MSHPTQTLRDKVWSVLNNVWAGDSEEDLYIKTDAILDLVREALLSDEAVEEVAYQILWAERGTGIEGKTLIQPESRHRGDARMALIAALDAITTDYPHHS